MNYREGAWHAIVGLDPQYEHMKGCTAYDEYMVGYNNNVKPKKIEKVKSIVRTVPAENFMSTIAANVDNENVSDEQFREFIRNTLPIVQYEGASDDEISS